MAKHKIEMHIIYDSRKAQVWEFVFQDLNIGKWSTGKHCDGVGIVKKKRENRYVSKRWHPSFNPRPDTVFRHLRSDRGGGVVGATPLGVSKRSVVELSGKDQQIALAEYSRLMVLFLVLGQYLTQLWQVKVKILGNSMIFQLYESISATLSIVAAWNLHQRVPRSILHRMRYFDASWLNI